MRRILMSLILVGMVLPVAASKSLNLISYNIRYNNPHDGVNAWPNRKGEVMGLLNFHQADIFCVQEALHDQVLDLENGMRSFAYVGVGRDDGKEAGEYAAIFYNTNRFKLLDSGNFWLSENPDKPGLGWDAVCVRICTWAKFKDNKSNRKFFVFNTHFDHVGNEARIESAKLIHQKMQELGGEKLAVFLTGDFNLTPETKPIALLRSMWSDSRRVSVAPPYGPKGTFNSFNFNHPLDQTIDYIFVNDRISVLRYGVLSDSRECRYPSDHLPVFVEAELK